MKNVDNYVRNKIAEVLAGSESTNSTARPHNDVNEQPGWVDKGRSYTDRDREWAQERAGSYLPNTHLAKTTLPSAVNPSRPAGPPHGHHDVDPRQRSPRGSTEEPPHGGGSGISPRAMQHHRGAEYRDYHSPRSYIVAGMYCI